MAKAAKPKISSTGTDNTFQLDGKTYKVLIPKMNIPEIGERTALEVCADPEAQQALIDRNCIGSVLEEVAE